MYKTRPADHSPAHELLAEVTRLREECDKLKREKKILERLVYTDELTGLHNFRYLTRRLEEERARASRHSRDFSLIMIDIDNLKRINELYGYNMGNHVIIEISKCIRNTLRNIDIVSRFGGDEFVIILPDTSARHALFVAERLTESIENLSFAGSDLRISVSGGIVFHSDRIRTGNEMLKQAEQLLYVAKRQGKNCVNFVMSEDFLEKSPCSVN